MRYLRSSGYPVPEIYELSEDGRDLVMERVEGPTMVEAIERAPWTIRRHARTLAELHARLHELEAPDALREAPAGRGDRVVHLDLHPLNVLVSPHGPVVIDWANAARGDPYVDVCTAWALMACAELPSSTLKAKVLGLGRSVALSSFLARFDRDRLATTLRTTVQWKTNDAHLSQREIAAMWALVERVERGRTIATDR
jgi:aminoglycoside phosphotransferase (APT) family kinase protein